MSRFSDDDGATGPGYTDLSLYEVHKLVIRSSPDTDRPAPGAGSADVHLDREHDTRVGSSSARDRDELESVARSVFASYPGEVVDAFLDHMRSKGVSAPLFYFYLDQLALPAEQYAERFYDRWSRTSH